MDEKQNQKNKKKSEEKIRKNPLVLATHPAAILIQLRP